jgi:RNA polymerase sigma-70 factor (ECF subfamily)
MQVQSHTVVPAREADRSTRYGSIRFAQPFLSLENGEKQTQLPTTVSHEPGAVGSETQGMPIHRDQLYTEFRPLVRRLLRQYGDNADIRNDLEGEIYYRFCILFRAFDPNRGVPLRPYLVRQLSASIHTFARSHWCRKRREVSLETFSSEGGMMPSFDPTYDWDDALNLQNIKRSLPAAIAKLSERQRNVLIWRYYEDSNFVEIANRLGVQAATARSLLRHALNRLRNYMGSAV